MKYTFIAMLMFLSYVGFSQDITNSIYQVKTDTSHAWAAASHAVISLELAGAGKDRLFVIFDNGNQIDLLTALKLTTPCCNFISCPQVVKNIMTCINYMERRGYTLVTSTGFYATRYSAQYIFVKK
jgi:hypothetical protein